MIGCVVCLTQTVSSHSSSGYVCFSCVSDTAIYELLVSPVNTLISSGAAHRCMDVSGLVGSSLQAGCLSGCPVRCEPRDTATVTAKVVDVFTKDGSFAN